MSLFQLLYRLKGCSLIVCHVLIPSFIEFLELKLLSTFHGSQLLLLCYPHVFGLSSTLHLAQLLKSVPENLGPLVLSVFLATFPEFIRDSIVVQGRMRKRAKLTSRKR